MQSDFVTSDLIVSAMAVIGVIQLAWLSVLLRRRGTEAWTIQQMLLPPLSLWVLMWPVYVDKQWLWLPLLFLGLLTLLSMLLKGETFKLLATAWQPLSLRRSFAPAQSARPLPLLPLQCALWVAGGWFFYIPEFGFGVALCLCFAFPLANVVDHFGGRTLGLVKLGFPTHPDQTLGGHLVFIVIATAILCWSLHVYHGTAWQLLFIATLITGMLASATRAIIPGQWNMPAAMAGMGAAMWVL